MKLLALSIFCFAILSCSKTDSKKGHQSEDTTVVGKWKEFENYMSPGSTWHWEAKSNIEIEIKSDFTYSTNNDSYFWGRSGRIENIQILHFS